MAHYRSKSGHPPYLPPAGAYNPNYGPIWDSYYMMPAYGPNPALPPWSYSFPPQQSGHFQPCYNCPYRLNSHPQPYHAAQQPQSHAPQQYSSNDQGSPMTKYPYQPKKKKSKSPMTEVDSAAGPQPETKSPNYKTRKYSGDR